MLNDLWYLLMPSIPGERTLLYVSVLGVFGIVWIINLVAHKIILQCKLSYLLNTELLSAGILGIWNIGYAFWTVPTTQHNFARNLSDRYLFGQTNRYTADAKIYTSHHLLLHVIRALLNMILMALIWQHASFDTWRTSTYQTLINVGLSSPYLTAPAPLQQVNLTFVSQSHICVVAMPNTAVIPIGHYAPFVWDPAVTVADPALFTIEQTRSQHPAVTLTPVQCEQNQCRVHLQIQPNVASIIIGYDNPAAVSQLELLIDRWYISAVPRQMHDALYYLEIRPDGIASIAPSERVRALCAK